MEPETNRDEHEPRPVEGRALELSTLPPAIVRELVAVLSPKGPALLAAPDRFALRERLLIGLAFAALFALPALAARGFGGPCTPREDLGWSLVYALPLVPLALLIVRATQWSLMARRMPFAPGVYVLDRDIVLAHGPRLQVLPLTALAGVSAPRRAPLGGRAEITLWMEGAPAETCSVAALNAESLVERLERARDTAVAMQAEAPVRGARRHDALSELKRSSAWDRSLTTPPRNEWPASIAVGVPLAMAAGLGVMMLRNVASDAIALASATAATELAPLECYVEAGGAQAERARTDILPRTAHRLAVEAGDSASLGQYVERFPDGPDTAAARERWIAMEYAQAGESAWSLRAFVARFPDAPQTAIARAALPRLALEEARRADAADAYTYVINEYAGTPEGAEAVSLRHARYETALASLRARGGRPEAAAFLAALFAYLESHDGPPVLVRFRTPSNESLRDFDAVVADGQNVRVEPIAPSFARRVSERREALVFDRLNTALEPLVARDVLRLARGGNLPAIPGEEELAPRLEVLPEEERAAERARILEQAENDSGQPEIRIDYGVIPSGGVYLSHASTMPSSLDDMLAGVLDPREQVVDGRRFAGFSIAFVIEMRVPESAERHSFTMIVEPEAHVQVDGGDDAPTDATIYEVLATSAFDRLAVGLEQALLGAGETPAAE